VEQGAGTAARAQHESHPGRRRPCAGRTRPPFREVRHYSPQRSAAAASVDVLGVDLPSVGRPNRSVEFRDELPKGGTGKVLKEELR